MLSHKKSNKVNIHNIYTAISNITDDSQYIIGNEVIDTQNEYKWNLTVGVSGYLSVGVIETKDEYSSVITSQKLSVIKNDVIKMCVNNNIVTVTHESVCVKTYTLQVEKSMVYPWIGSMKGYKFNVNIRKDVSSELIAQPDGSFKIVNQMEVLNNSKIQKHIINSDRHFLQREIDHKKIQNSGTILHEQIDEHINNNDIHFTVDNIDHDRINNNGRFSHTDIDKHLTNIPVHFTEQSILHDNIANVGHFTHPQIDTHIRRHDLHFKLDDIDHIKIKNIGKHSHSDIDFHLDNNLVHHQLNDIAITKKSIWSSEKIKKELDSLSESKLSHKGGYIDGCLDVKDNIIVPSLHIESLIVKGVKQDFTKKIYSSWLYNSTEGCHIDIPCGGKYKIISATNTIAKSGGSSCIYKIMYNSGLPEINLSNATSTGEINIHTENEILVEIDFHICSELNNLCSWNYRLTIGTSHYYYKQKHGPNNTIESSGKIVTKLNGNTPIYLSVGDCQNGPIITLNSVLLNVKQLF
jgi:hypothetical protein